MAEVSAENKAKVSCCLFGMTFYGLILKFLFSQALASKNEGNEFYKKRDFEKAIACYEKAIELDPSDMTYINNKAAVYFEQNNYKDCIQECEKALDVGRENRNDFKLIAK